MLYKALSVCLYHLVHGVVGVEVLSVSAADPGRFEQLVLFFLIVSFLFVPVSVSFTLPFTLPFTLSLRKGVFRISAPGRRITSLFTRRAL